LEAARVLQALSKICKRKFLFTGGTTTCDIRCDAPFNGINSIGQKRLFDIGFSAKAFDATTFLLAINFGAF
jgi:hypothetical protein